MLDELSQESEQSGKRADELQRRVDELEKELQHFRLKKAETEQKFQVREC